MPRLAASTSPVTVLTVPMTRSFVRSGPARLLIDNHLESRKVVDDGLPDLVQPDLRVSVRQHVAEVADLPPADLRVARLELVGEVGSSIGRRFHAPQHGILGSEIGR